MSSRELFLKNARIWRIAMKRVIIAGGGFAGLSAAKPLGRYIRNAHDAEIIIFDKNDYSAMIPSLPDIAGGRLRPGTLKVKIRKQLPRGVEFRQEEIQKIDLDARTVTTHFAEYHYDYLIFCPGSVTNFFGFDQQLDRVFVLDSLEGALSLKEEFDAYLKNCESCTLVISGAGFTGIEAACCLAARARKKSRPLSVFLVEKSDRVLGNLAEQVSRYVDSLISKLEFNTIRSSSIKTFEGSTITLETGEVFKDAFFVWTSGSKRKIENVSGKFSALPDGRLMVNKCLQLPEHENVFVAGDGAAIASRNGYRRKGVAFSVGSGRRASRNVVRSIEDRRLRAYRPIDIGWQIPLYPSGIGNLLGVTVKGRLALSFHYFACAIRIHSLTSRISYALMGLKSLFL
jgi:NADH:quinone reductase (non-electrogenic)